MTTLNPRSVRIMFTASVVMVTLSLVMSAFSVATVLSAPRASTVAVPNLVGFEGFLADGSGNPIADGNYTLTFAIYSVASGGSALWTEQQTSVPVTKGLYAVTLGSVTSLSSSLFDGNRWIGVTVGTGSEMTPRTRIASVPFALNADSANKVGGASLQGMIAAFESSCPSGWSEMTSTRGRTIVGVPAGGTAAGTVGITPLSNLEDRAHSHTTPNHTHDLATSGTTLTGNDNANNPLYRVGNSPTGNLVSGANGSFTRDYITARTTSGGGGVTGVAHTSDVMPYIQLYYCKFTATP